ncbi:MAG: rhombotarget lipoprotein [Gammaproteobacteria bacterium]|nr:rhombotarget lipoprotein [Gammaproteobacteria bacterium]
MKLRTITVALLAVLMSACAAKQSRLVSNTYEFLYPNEEARTIEPQMAVLEIPVRVGLAFAPTTQGHSRFDLWSGRTMSGEDLSATEKQKILRRIADAFRGKEYVAAIEIIPDAYLRNKGGFENLDQLATMYNVDVMALVSYDQMQATDEGASSLAYWTLVGAYVVSGEKNSTTTLIDTAVFDIDSRRMLFRAPGTSEIKASSTLVNLSEALREDSQKGFEQASAQMIENLDAELERFREKIKEQPETFKVKERAGYSGGGGVALLLPLVLLGLRVLRD